MYKILPAATYSPAKAVPSALEGLTSTPAGLATVWGPLVDRVRNGNGCFPSAIATGNLDPQNCTKPYRSSPRLISTGQLRVFPLLHPRPIYLVVFEVSYPSRMGNLILRRASRLDAFSVYPFRTWLPSCAPGGATGTPSVRPPRSSRTRGSASQVSYARDG